MQSITGHEHIHLIQLNDSHSARCTLFIRASTSFSPQALVMEAPREVRSTEAAAAAAPLVALVRQGSLAQQAAAACALQVVLLSTLFSYGPLSGPTLASTHPNHPPARPPRTVPTLWTLCPHCLLVHPTSTTESG